jgi:hypothetical protein
MAVCNSSMVKSKKFFVVPNSKNDFKELSYPSRIMAKLAKMALKTNGLFKMATALPSSQTTLH